MNSRRDSRLGIHLAILLAILLALTCLAACGDGGGLPGPRHPGTLNTQLLVESTPDGVVEAVRIDSAFWNPAVLLHTGDDAVLEVEGPFFVRFFNAADTTLVLRYDLRFLDDGGFLVDRFIPFGQPLNLAPGESSQQAGTFVIRSSPDIGRFGLATMQIAVRLTLPAAAPVGKAAF